jgi:hypothetical protein
MMRFAFLLAAVLLGAATPTARADDGGTPTTGFRDWTETRTARVCGQIHEGNRSTDACWTDSYQVAIGLRGALPDAAEAALLERARRLVR